MGSESHLGRVKYGKDDTLEELADKLLANSAGDNARSIDRDIEKASYDAGLITVDELQLYDPGNDWDTRDSAFTIYINPGDMAYITPSECADQGDGNIRAEHPELLERRALMRHTGDDDGWGSTVEESPPLGINKGPRKTCTKCKQPKGLQYFSPDARNKGGLRSWCRKCEKERAKNRYTRKKK
ncbi:hypothetical protein [Mycobacterium phage WXIN]|nr:hypothetical protein [Mycobacterium phage WXIN]